MACEAFDECRACRSRRIIGGAIIGACKRRFGRDCTSFCAGRGSHVFICRGKEASGATIGVPWWRFPMTFHKNGSGRCVLLLS